MLTFEQIFKAMKQLADRGDEFFFKAVFDYENADKEQKRYMEKWLMEEFEDYDPKNMSIESALILMSFAL